jgi:Zn-dependent protease
MFNKKELISLLIASLVLGYVSSYKSLTWLGWVSMAGLALIVLFVHHFGQKITALFYDCSTEAKLWTVRQFSFGKSSHFKFDFPMWAAFPVFLVIFTLGGLKWLALTTFEAVPLPARIHRKYAELTDWDLALIAAGGLFFNALLAVIAHLLGFDMFAMLNLFFVMFNLIPFSNLDGGKIFFGSVMLWVFCSVFTAILWLLLGHISLITNIAAALVIAVVAVILYYINMKR